MCSDAAFPTKAVAALACLPFSDGYAAGAYAGNVGISWRVTVDCCCLD